MNWNKSKTYLSFYYDKYKYCITGSIDKCNICDDNKFKMCIIEGMTNNYNNWITTCVGHLREIACKPQYCNVCNIKAKLDNDKANLCFKCLIKICDNTKYLYNTCKYPFNECNCKFCNL